MAFESNPNSVVEQLCQSVSLPKMVRVHQKFDSTHFEPEELPAVVHAQLERENIRKQIRPGMSIAITCGSRGIANIAIIVRAIVDFVKECGANPFVFPAMGSHGGATPEGQLEVLRSYHVTEETMGCPIRATMETVYLGDTVEGKPVFSDKYAHEADGVILCGRIKPHTSFRGPYESGLLKMAVIGMGKQHGAESVHESGFQNMGRIMPQFARVVFDHTNILAGVGIIENAYDQTYKIAALDAQEIWEQEPALLQEANRMMGRLWIEKTDVLVVDRLGKNISGDGMDPNVSGRFVQPKYCSGGIEAEKVVILDLTDETHGNAQGIGLAEVTTRRLYNKMKLEMTYPTGVTNTFLHLMKIPMIMDNDREALQLALCCCPDAEDQNNMKMIRIPNTAHIEYIEISEGLLPQAKANPNIEILSEPYDLEFDENGNLF